MSLFSGDWRQDRERGFSQLFLHMFFSLLFGCGEVLLTAQDETEANEVLSALELAGLSSSKHQSGAQFEVIVPVGKVPESWRALRTQGLPWRRRAHPLEAGLWEGTKAAAVRLRERRASQLAESLEGWRAVRGVRLHLNENSGAAFIWLNRAPGPLLKRSIEAFIRDGAPLSPEKPLTLKLQGPQRSIATPTSASAPPRGLWEWLSVAPYSAFLLLFSSLLLTVIAYFWGARQPIIISPAREPRSSSDGDTAQPEEPVGITQERERVE